MDLSDQRLRGIEAGLLPCPFCGGKPRYHEVSPSVSMLPCTINCQTCRIEHSGSDTWTAVKSWQTRHPTPFSLAEAEHMRLQIPAPKGGVYPQNDPMDRLCERRLDEYIGWLKEPV